MGYLIDITQNILAEQALRVSEARYERAVNGANEGIWDWDITAGEAYASPRWKQLLGYQDHELTNAEKFFFEAIHPDDQAAVRQAIKAHFEQHKPYSIELRLRCKNGRYRWFYSRGQAIWDEAGQPLRMAGSITDITERKLVEQALRESQTRLALALNCAKAGTWDWHIPSGRVIFNERWAFMRGYRPDEVEPDISSWERDLCQEDLPAIQERLRDHFENRTDFFRAEYRVRNKTGTWIWIMDRGSVIERDAQGKPVRMIGIEIDISDSKLEVQQQLRIAATAFGSQEGMVITKADGTILRVNPAFTQITGYSPEEVVGRTPGQLLNAGCQSKEFYRDMWQQLKTTGTWKGELWEKRKNGERFAAQLTLTEVNGTDEHAKKYVGTITDITLRKNTEKEITHMAFYDHLTHLPNRRLLMDRLEHTWASHLRSKGSAALLFVDLDHFKTLNDTLGHDMDDLLLQQVARRLESCMREGDTVARIGGDEFAIVLENLGDNVLEAAALTKTIGDKILASLNQPYPLDHHRFNTTSSIGATLFSKQQRSVDELLKEADLAMYHAKTAGRNALHFFDPRMQAGIESRMSLEADLRTALTNDQFALYYQCQTNSRRQVIGAEALIRWQHPQRGLLMPASFIHLAEKNDLILAIDQWVLKTASRQIQQWQKHNHTQHLHLSVNMSARQFKHPECVQQISQILSDTGISPHRLKLELTEMLLHNNINNTVAKMEALRKLGVCLSLQDFGTGYSSLAHLTRLPIDQLKIQRAFLRHIETRISDAVIVETIINMAGKLGIELVASGVEKESQAVFLAHHQCPCYQGYLFGKPLPLDQFEKQLVMH